MNLKPLVLALCLLAPTVGFAQAVPASETAINAVIESFRTSIITKDQTTFLNLFHGKSIPWIGVLDDESLQRVRKQNSKASKADPMGTPGPVPFMKWIKGSKMLIEEKFSNIRITTDASIASVVFDYSFHQGAYKSNRGQEAWQLVNTDKGWKINSVIYTIHANPEPAPKP